MTRSLPLLLAVGLLAACADEGPVAGPGVMTASLVSPNGAEGAAVVTLVGDGVGTVTGLGQAEVYSWAADDGARVVLIHPTGGDLAFQVAVADTTQPPVGLVREVAAPDDALRADLTGYALEIAR